MPIEVDASQVHSIEVDPSQVSAAPEKESYGAGVWKNLPHPIDFVKSLGDRLQGHVETATEAFKKGDYKTAAEHMLMGTMPIADMLKQGGEGSAAALDRADAAKAKGDTAQRVIEDVNAVPFVGPIAGSIAQQAKEGNLEGAAGETTGAAISALLPKIGKALPKSAAIVPRLGAGLTPEETASNAFAHSEGIPIPAATETGNKFVKNMQAVAANQPVGALIAKKATSATRGALENTAADILKQAGPAAVPESAGAATAAEVGGLERAQAKGAAKAYGKLESIEANPQHTQSVQIGTEVPAGAKQQLDELAKSMAGTTYDQVTDPARKAALDQIAQKLGIDATPKPILKDIALPVDMRAAKATLRPVLERLEQEMPLAQQQSSRGLLGIRNIVNGEDYLPASVADQNLSALKQLQRESVHPKTQFLAGKAIDAVAPLVDKAVAAAGPDATQALNDGRALTKAKFATQATMEQLPDEPVKLFNKLTLQKDSGINLLRDVQSKAPGSIPALGRAYLEGLTEAATAAEGQTPGPAKAFSDWRKLGDSTKQILFPDPALRGRIDNFFTLAKRLADNPNPSGSGLVLSSVPAGMFVTNPVTEAGYLLGGAALAKLLYSERGAALLTNGLRLKVGNPGAALVASKILQAAGNDVKEVPSGASVQTQSNAQPANQGTR